MKTLAVVSQKGGAGKTTLAIHLAVAAHRAGYSTAIFDMDPQGTAEAWAQWRGEEEPAVIAAKASTLPRMLEKARAAGADIVVIDTPPLAEAEAREAARMADLVLIPCRPRAFDLHAIRTTADLARFAGKPAFAVFNAAPARAPTLYAEAKGVVEQIGLKVAPVMVADRAAFHHSTGGGKAAQEIEPDSKAAEEISKLWEWLCEQVNMPSRYHVNMKTRARA